MFSKMHVEDSTPHDEEPACQAKCDWVVQPMRWGLIPSWYHGEANSIEYKMNNARSDSLLSKASFKSPLERGRRCVILADGYYEWNQASDGKKQPYFVYFPQQACSAFCFDVSEDPAVKAESNVERLASNQLQGNCSGTKLLTMAGVFDIRKQPDSDVMLFSYSVITVDAHDKLAWMHHRMPAILDGPEEIMAWLDYESVPLTKALKLIRPMDCVRWHAVSSVVNNSRNQSEDCRTAYKPETDKIKKPCASASAMKAWLSTTSKRSSPDTITSSVNKKPKDLLKAWLTTSSKRSSSDDITSSVNKKPKDLFSKQ